MASATTGSSPHYALKYKRSLATPLSTVIVVALHVQTQEKEPTVSFSLLSSDQKEIEVNIFKSETLWG